MVMFKLAARSLVDFRPAIRSFSTTGGVASKNRHRLARVLVVGSGRMGQIRASLVRANPRFELCGVVDPNAVSAQYLAEKYGVESFTNLTHAIETTTIDQPLDGLIVSSPTFTHQAVVREACENRVSVFTEKPVDETADKIEALFGLSAVAGVALCCGFQRRFDPSYVAASQAVMSGQVIGTPVQANIFFADHPVPPKQFLLSGGNIFMDLSAHDVDYITYTLQDEVVSVYATGVSSDADLAAAGVHDSATLVMNFRRGTVVTLFMSRSASYGYDQRCEIFGSEGLVSVGNVQANTTVLSTRTGVLQSRLQHSFPQRFNEAFGQELDAFCNTVLMGDPWPVTREQCIRVQRVADAARLSADTGQVIEIEPYVPRGHVLAEAAPDDAAAAS